jgi:hypothetical protein
MVSKIIDEGSIPSSSEVKNDIFDNKLYLKMWYWILFFMIGYFTTTWLVWELIIDDPNDADNIEFRQLQREMELELTAFENDPNYDYYTVIEMEDGTIHVIPDKKPRRKNKIDLTNPYNQVD